MSEPFVTPGLFWDDFFHSLAILGGVALLISMSILALGLKNTRQWGCYCVVGFCLLEISFEYEAMGSPVIWSDLFIIPALVTGFVYCAKVMGKEDWRHPAHL